MPNRPPPKTRPSARTSPKQSAAALRRGRAAADAVVARRALQQLRKLRALARQVDHAVESANGAVAEMLYSVARRRGLVVMTGDQARQLGADHAEILVERDRLRAQISELEYKLALTIASTADWAPPASQGDPLAAARRGAFDPGGCPAEPAAEIGSQS